MQKKDALYIPINITGFVLAFVAGWIDVFALRFVLKENTSFLTGRVAKLGESLLQGDISGFMLLILIILSFVIGAFVSAFVTQRKGLSAGLYLSGIAILITALLVLVGDKTTNFAFFLIPFAMGAQNAATSLTPIGRTTHMTGPITDIGIYMSRGNWRCVLRLVIRLFAFVLGTTASFCLLGLVDENSFLAALAIFVPGLIVILTGVLQKKICDIPILKDYGQN